MAPTLSTLASIASILTLAPTALAGFNPTGVDNISVYWGKQDTYIDST